MPNTYCRLVLSAIIAGTMFSSALHGQDTLVTAVATASAKPSTTLCTAPVQAIDSKEFQKLGYNDLYEAVRGFAGASIKDYGGIGGVKTVSIRSLGAQHTSVSYDGVALSDLQSGQIDIGRFSLENVEVVSLSIGQSDNIFQTARLFSGAGALEIRTLEPRFDGKSTNAAVALKAGSYSTYNPALLLEQRLGQRWSLSLTSDYLTSKGNYPFTLDNERKVEELTRENSDVSRLRAELNLFGKIGRCGTLKIKSNWLGSERGLPGAVILYNPTSTERLYDRSTFTSASYHTPLGTKWELQGHLKYNYAWTRYTKLSEQIKGGMEDDRYTQCEYYGSAAAQYRPTEKLRFSAAQDIFYTTLDSNIPECAFPRRWSFLTSVAGQYKSKRLTATASLMGTFITETVKTGTQAPDRVHFSPAASISYKLLTDKELRIRASYKDGFRVPTFNDLYYSRTGNRNLKPEKAHQFNLGLTYTGPLKASADIWYNHVTDKIATIPTMFIWKTFNIGQVNIWGVDLSAGGNILINADHTIALSANYTFQRADEVIPYTPENSGTATATWTNPWVDVSYILTATGERYALPEAVERNLVEGYLDHSVSLGHNFTFKKFGISLRGEILNITNVNYAVIKYYPMPGRNYRLTLKFTF